MLTNNPTVSELFRDEMRKVFGELESLETSTSGPDGDEYPLSVNRAILDHFDRLLEVMVELKGTTFGKEQAELIKAYTSNPVRFLAAEGGVKDCHITFFETNDFVRILFLDLEGRIVWVDNSEGTADVRVSPRNESPFILHQVNTLLLKKW